MLILFLHKLVAQFSSDSRLYFMMFMVAVTKITKMKRARTNVTFFKLKMFASLLENADKHGIRRFQSNPFQT